jgi:hypothetical protein
MTIWYNIGLFGIVCGHLVYFSRFGMFGPRKIWQPCLRRQNKKIKIENGDRICLCMYICTCTFVHVHTCKAVNVVNKDVGLQS